MSQLVTSDNVTDTDQVRSLPEDSKPVQLPATLDINRKPKIVPTATTNGHTNGHPESSGTKRKRSLEGDPEQNLKRSKMQAGAKAEAPQSDNVVIEDDEHNGAIVIDSD